MKKLAVMLCCFFAIQNMYAQPETLVLDKVIAKVGDRIILHSDIEEQYRALDYKPEDARCMILDHLLTQNLLLAQAEIDSVVVDEADVESQLNARIERILQMMGYDRSQFITYYGRTPEEVKEDFRTDLEGQLVAQRMQMTVMEGLKITPSEVKAFFGKIPKDSLPYFNSEVEIGEIVVEPKPNEIQKEQAKKQLETIRQRIVNGEEFAMLAKQFSEDPGSAKRGGDLGWGKRGSYVPEFEAAAFRLEPNELSPVIKTEYGYHIIQLLERRGNLIHLRHILVKPRITEADKLLAQAQLDTIRNLIVTDSISFARAVFKYSSDNAQSKTNAGLMMNPRSGTTTFEVADLDPIVYFTIDTMKVGDISAPMEYTDPQTGEDAYRIIWLRYRTNPHQANLQEDYSKIQSAALEQKKANYLSEWVTQKVKGMYIHIDPAFDCEVLDKWRNESKTASTKP
jgi:peptidyl-prolyl cis-trans isomerase SurA